MVPLTSCFLSTTNTCAREALCCQGEGGGGHLRLIHLRRMIDDFEAVLVGFFDTSIQYLVGSTVDGRRDNGFFVELYKQPIPDCPAYRICRKIY